MEWDTYALLNNAISQLRMNLSSLQIAATLLAPDSVREKDRKIDEVAAIVDQSIYQMIRIFDNLAAAQNLDDNELLPFWDGDIVRLANEVFNRTDYLASLKDLETSFVCAMDSHICAYNPRGIEQLLFHLLSNAIKFTPPGGLITLEVRLVKGQIQLIVQDTGPGIPKEQQFTLFNRWRTMDGQNPPPQGTGLGLAVCQHIARCHGTEVHRGTLVLDDSYTKGCRFVFSMPHHIVNRTILKDPDSIYRRGINPTLLGLADALPTEAFLLYNQD